MQENTIMREQCQNANKTWFPSSLELILTGTDMLISAMSSKRNDMFLWNRSAARSDIHNDIVLHILTYAIARVTREQFGVENVGPVSPN